MRALDKYNPITVFLYFAAVTSIVMFNTDPIFILLSTVGACTTFFTYNKTFRTKDCASLFLLFSIIAVINPLFNHNGVTVIFILNNNPITAEAVLYGITSALAVVGVICWFRSFSLVITSDKLLFLFGSISPKFALILSMTLRYIPLFKQQTQKVVQAQQALGIYSDNDLASKIKSRIRVFSVMVTWALENGITTSDSMTARGYGTCKRTHFSRFKFNRRDLIFTLTTVVLFLTVITGIATSAVGFEFYPRIRSAKISVLSVITYCAYGLLAILPSIAEVRGNIAYKVNDSKMQKNQVHA